MPNPYSLTPLVPHELGRLFVLAFPDEGTAFTLRDTLLKWEEDSIIDVGDMVVVTRDRQGRVRLHQSLPLTAVGSALGSLGGMVFGMMLLNPLFGSIAGAAVGAAAGAMQDIGISDEFMRELGETLTLGTSALFVTVRSSKPQPLLERLQAFAGTCRILQCDMPAENEVLLRRVLEGEGLQTSSGGAKN
ncbi:MAG: DUF1269 domain-containing protein [Burkholderiales bacterium]